MMSNDTKFWLWRIGLFGVVFADVSVFFKGMEKIQSADPNVSWWFAAFFVCAVVSLGAGFMYTVAKQKRWEDAAPKADDLSILQAYSQDLKASKEQDKQPSAQQKR